MISLLIVKPDNGKTTNEKIRQRKRQNNRTWHDLSKKFLKAMTRAERPG
jgi:hypothetical protein